MDAGLDSLGMVEMGQRIVSTVGIELPSTVAFDYPSVTDMVAYITTRLGKASICLKNKMK
jgi:acyl carrier protein